MTPLPSLKGNLMTIDIKQTLKANKKALIRTTIVVAGVAAGITAVALISRTIDVAEETLEVASDVLDAAVSA
jgi:hypothetical protein